MTEVRKTRALLRQFLLAGRPRIQALVVLVAIFDWSEIATRFEPVEGSLHVLRSFVA
jgi:hypothetical protein